MELAEGYAQAPGTNAETRKSFPGVYVKVYAKMQDGSIRFYKAASTTAPSRRTSSMVREAPLPKR